MRTFNAFLGALATLAVLASPAYSADLYAHGGYKDGSAPIVSDSQAISGPYVEVAIGPSFSSSTANLSRTDIDLGAQGGYFGGRAGYDLSLASFANKKFGIGVWGEVGTNFDAGGTIAGVVNWNKDLNWGAGGKVFYDHGSGQIYGILGYTGEDFNISSGATKIDKTLTGYEWGTGISLLLSKGWYGKLEFDQVRFNDETIVAGGLKWQQVDNRVLFGTGVSLGSAFTPLK